jgi:hypothetical protein
MPGVPEVTLVEPNYGRPGDTITITGIDFGPYEDDSVVEITDVECVITSWSDTEIECLIPQTISGDLVVKSRTNDVTDYGATDAGIGDDTDDIQDAIDDLPIW